MKRFFFFTLPNLLYEKNDLNIPTSTNRRNLGLLTNQITHCLFLSHSLRKDIIIRIMVNQPIKHLIQLKSETIRYLGPEERSLSSLLLKVEKDIQFKIENNFDFKNWFEPNPGILVKITENYFEEISDVKIKEKTALLCFEFINNSETLKRNYTTSYEFFENQLEKLREAYSSFALHYDFLTKSFTPINNQIANYETHSFKLPNDYLPNQWIGIINLLLDK